MATYTFLDVPATSSEPGYQPRGGALRLWKSKASQVVISGPAETGKSYGALQKVDAMCWKHPGLQVLMMRKTYRDLVDSVVVTYEKKILGARRNGVYRQEFSPVQKYGGESPQHFDYPNGSRIRLGGMDRPGKVLSSEYDVIYVPQCEELTLDQWETMSTRCTGRAGNLPWGAQMIGDCNPGAPTHWILAKRDNGILEFIESRHEDNPVLFDDNGRITPQGIKSLATLDSLTGARKQRLRYGKWVQAEGVVYDAWDAAVHLISPTDTRFGFTDDPDNPIPASWTRIRAVDFGYVNPFVCLWMARDHDGRLFVYRQLYHTQRTVAVHAEQINRLSRGETYEATVCDHDSEDRATLRAHDIENIAAYKDIKRGIEAMQERLKVQPDGKARFYVLDNSLVERDELLHEKRKPINLQQEMDVYVWQQTPDGRPDKEIPMDLDNHALDSARYGVAYFDLRHKSVPLPRNRPTSFYRD